MRNLARFIFLEAIFSVISITSGWAGPESQFFVHNQTNTTTGLEKPAIDLFAYRTSYVFESELENNGSFGKQAAWQNLFDYGHRFLLTGSLYLHAGFDYERFNFSQTDAPVPGHLQSIAGVIGLDYMHGSDLGAFIQFRPGFYAENDFNISSFDVPTTLGRVFVLQENRLYFFLGMRAALLSGKYPVIPLAGIVYRPNPQWSFDLVPPEPRITYAPSKRFSVFVGGELVGGSYRTDQNANIVPSKLSGAQIDYTDYRAGAGIIYSPCKALTIDLAGGYSIERSIDYHRAGENFTTDPAPYFRASITAQF